VMRGLAIRCLVIVLMLVGCVPGELPVAEEPEPAAFPVLLDLTDLSDCQRDTALQAMEQWNSAVGAPVFAEGEGKVVLTSEAYPDAFIYTDGDLESGATMYLGHNLPAGWEPYECSWRASIAFELGRLIGVPEDDYEFSLMNFGPAPNGMVLPVHVEIVRELMAP